MCGGGGPGEKETMPLNIRVEECRLILSTHAIRRLAQQKEKLPKSRVCRDGQNDQEGIWALGGEVLPALTFYYLSSRLCLKQGAK